jgi:uncharacterized membrane protein YqiK
MSATLGKSPPPTGSAAAFQVVVHSITNVHSSCPWYIKAKLGYAKKQKSKAIKQHNNTIQFDETFYFERWDTKEVVLLSIWKERNKLQHVEVASLELACPAAKHYPSCTYELKTELFPTPKAGDAKAHETRARANTAEAEGGQGIDASKPCGEITITVTHVPGNHRWQQLQKAGGEGAAADAPATEQKVASDGPGSPQQSKKAELMKAAAEHKAEKDKPQDKPAESASAESEKPADAKPADANPVDAKPADAKPAETPAAESASVSTEASVGPGSVSVDAATS